MPSHGPWGLSLHISTPTTFNGDRMLTLLPVPVTYLRAVSANFVLSRRKSFKYNFKNGKEK